MAHINMTPVSTQEATTPPSTQTKTLSPEQIWKAVLGELELSISKANFTTWFKSTSILRYQDGEAVVLVPNMFTKNWLQNKYHKEISRALQHVTGEHIRKISYELHSQAESVQEQYAKEEAKAEVQTPATQPSSTIGTVTADSIPPAQITTGPTSVPNETTSLNSKYSFDNLIVGSNNELAIAAARAVANNPGTMYNPLFIYGGVGLGKTHLIQSIGNAIANEGQKKVVYVTCERFTDDFIKYIQNAKGREGDSSVFKQKYRTADVLIIDDIQFLSGKERTQEEFFHTFNELHQNNKQVVITSDRPPKAILHLEDRLISRFEGGMIADISMPDFETRKAILRSKCAEKNISLPEEVADYIAQHVQSNVRELEGAVARVIARCEMSNTEPTQEIVKSILSSTTGEQRSAVTPKRILDVVSGFYNIEIDELLAKNRKKEIVWPRQIAMYLMRTESKTSYPSIGQHIGGRDHTTAIHAFEKVTKLLEEEEGLQQEMEILKQKLYL